MSWNYRIIKHAPKQFALHEVYYNKQGKVYGWLENPEVWGESPAIVAKVLKMMLHDAEKRPTLSLVRLKKRMK